MSSNQLRESFPLRLRRLEARLQRLGTTPGRLLVRLADYVAPVNSHWGRRQMRRWLEANGLTIVLVSAMMILAWMIAEG
jgi:hypothetical protein